MQVFRAVLVSGTLWMENATFLDMEPAQTRMKVPKTQGSEKAGLNKQTLDSHMPLHHSTGFNIR